MSNDKVVVFCSLAAGVATWFASGELGNAIVAALLIGWISVLVTESGWLR